MDYYTISIRKGDGNIRHNKRTQKKKQMHIDYNRTIDNVTFTDHSLDDVYHELFDDAVIKYNMKQKRNDRKIDNYLQKIKKSKKTQAFHELIFQLGDMTSHPTEEQMKEICKEFLDYFANTNPQFRIFGAYLHLDEATPHLHIDFVPYATYSRGIGKRPCFDQSLKQMGYGDFSQWINMMYYDFETILTSYFSIKRKEVAEEEKHEHKSKNEYIAYQRAIKTLKAEVDTLQKRSNLLSDEILAKHEQNIQLEENNARIENMSQKKVLELERLEKRTQEASKENLEIENTLSKQRLEMLSITRKLDYQEKKLNQQSQKIAEQCSTIEKNQNINAKLKFENQALKKNNVLFRLIDRIEKLKEMIIDYIHDKCLHLLTAEEKTEFIDDVYEPSFSDENSFSI